MNLLRLGVQMGPFLTLFFFLCVVGGLVLIRSARHRAKTTGFGVVRERADYAARRWMLGTCLLALFAGASMWLWATAVWNPQVLPTPAPTATLTLIPSPTPRPPTATPTRTPTPTATPTATPIAAAAVPTDAELPTTLRRGLPAGAATPSVNASLLDVTMASGQQGNRPVNPTTVFPRGTGRVYAFMVFDGMADSVAWSHVWYRQVDGEMREIWGRTELWSYEYSRGQIWRYFDCGVGNYELHIYLGYQLQQKVPFAVKGN